MATTLAWTSLDQFLEKMMADFSLLTIGPTNVDKFQGNEEGTKLYLYYPYKTKTNCSKHKVEIDRDSLVMWIP